MLSTKPDIADLFRDGAVHRAVYTDPALFALEHERVMRRAWLYVGHESEVRAPGDYLLTQLAGEEVILIRQDDGGLALLLNRCAHRGTCVLSAPTGHVQVLRCPYHAWAYRRDGSLIGVPRPQGYADFNPNDPALHLRPVARVASYRGFVFASHGASGPDLPNFLGPITAALDNMVDRAPNGTLSAISGKLRLQYRGNWKLFMENATDLVHPSFVHASSVAAARAHTDALTADPLSAQSAQMFLANGLTVAQWDAIPLHAHPGGHLYMGGFYRAGAIAPDRTDAVYLAYRAALVARLGEPRTAKVLAMDRFNNLIWPNLSVNSRFAVIRQVVPVAVDETIVVAQCFSFDGAPDAMTELSVQFINTAASPASLVASDDLEIFERCQRGLMTQSNDWIDIRRGISTDQRRSDGNVHASGSSELAVRHQLAQWRQWMQA